MAGELLSHIYYPNATNSHGVNRSNESSDSGSDSGADSGGGSGSLQPKREDLVRSSRLLAFDQQPFLPEGWSVKEALMEEKGCVCDVLFYTCSVQIYAIM